MTRFLNISTDNTLGGSSPSDVTVSSQKAVKEYVDSHSGSGAVNSVNGQTGTVVLTASDVGAQPAGNYMTTDTIQTVSQSATKTFNGRVNFLGTGDAKAIYLSTDTRIDVYGTSRTVLGFANGTFLINNSAYPLNLRGGGARPAWNGTSYLALTSDIGNATLTIQKNGTAVDTFTANATSDKTINITVPTDTGDLTNGAGFITGITSGDVTTALGYTPYDASNPNGYTSNTGTVTSVNNVSPVNGNVSLSIPTVNNPTITITQGGVTKGSFTLNQSTGDTIALDAGGGGSVNTFDLFDHKWSDYQLNDQSWLRADTFSWQDGTVYSDAYNHLVDDLSTATQKTDGIVDWTQPVLTGATTSTDLGNIVVTCSSNYSGYDAYKAMDGVKSGTTAASGWGTNNSTSGWWQVKFPYKLLITGLKGYQRYDGTPANANTVGRFYTSSDKTTPIGNEYNNATATNWNAVTVTGIPASGIITDTIYFDKTGGGAWGGLGELEITARRVASDYPITYYEAQDGHKICLPDQESTISNIYNESGVAWYYILDTANTRFKLPRENPAREELIQVIRSKGNGTALGMTDNGTITAYLARSGTTYTFGIENATNTTLPNKGISNSWDTGAIYDLVGVTTDSTKSGIISSMTDSTSVYKGKKYLYFYVGQFSQSATEQTAGLNAELFNGKLDLDLGNISNTSKETIVGWGMPDYSSGIDASVPYTAPKDGLLFIRIPNASADTTVYAVIDNNDVPLTHFYSRSAIQVSWCVVPIGKGQQLSSFKNISGTAGIKYYPVKGE